VLEFVILRSTSKKNRITDHSSKKRLKNIHNMILEKMKVYVKLAKINRASAPGEFEKERGQGFVSIIYSK